MVAVIGDSGLDAKMENWQAKILSVAIGSLEQGAFQQFCLEFLKIRSPELHDLARLGHTADRKTRKGHPDLYAVDDQGSITGVECSVDKKYRKRPADLLTWKPISDIRECRETLGSKLTRLLLCTSQDLGAEAARMKSDIVQHSQDEYSLSVEVLTGPDFEDEIQSDRVKYEGIIRGLWPELHSLLFPTQYTAAAVLAQRLYPQSDAPYDVLTSSIHRIAGGKEYRDITPADELAILAEASASARSRFQIRLPESGRVTRGVVWQVFDGTPFGRVLSIIGPPKLGKSTLVAQLCRTLQLPDDQIEWIVFPSQNEYYEPDAEQAVRHVLRLILQRFVVPIAVNDLLDGRRPPGDLKILQSGSLAKSQLIVIDNAEHLTQSDLGVLGRWFDIITKATGFSGLGVLFISNRPLKDSANFIRADYRCPPWTEDELLNLLRLEELLPDENIGKYIRLLSSLSRGHPLLCIAMARQFPTLAKLRLSSLEESPVPLYDPKFTEEVRSVLYEEILPDNNYRQFVEMISVFVFPFTVDGADYVKRKVFPQNSVSTIRMIRYLHGAVIEGDLDGSLTMAHVFQQVARKNVTKALRHEIYSSSADHCVTPEKGKFIVEKMCDGVIYYLAADEREKAFAYAALFGRNLLKLTKMQAEYITMRLLVLRFAPVPVSEAGLTVYVLFQLWFHLALWLAEKREDAFKCIKDLHGFVHTESTKLDSTLVDQIDWAWQHNSLNHLMRSQDYKGALNTISTIKVIKDTSQFESYDAILDLIPGLLANAAPSDVPIDFIVAVMEYTGPADDKRITRLLSCATAIGITMSKSSETIESVLESTEVKHPLWDIFSKTCVAQFRVSKGQESDALPELEGALACIREWADRPIKAGQHPMILQADAYYNLDQHAQAQEVYESLLSELSPEEDGFYYGWCESRLARLESDLDVAISRLRRAIPAFKSAWHYRDMSVALGELAIACALNGEIIEAIKTLEAIIDQYCLQGEEDFDTGAMVAGNLLSNISVNPEPQKETTADATGFLVLGLERGVFARARQGYKPLVGKGTLYWSVAEAYKSRGETANVRRVLRRLFDFPMISTRDFGPFVYGSFEVATSFKERAEHHLKGAEQIVQDSTMIESILAYGDFVIRVWAGFQYRRIALGDVKYARDLQDSALLIRDSEAPKDEKCTAMLLVLLAVAPTQKSHQILQLARAWVAAAAELIKQLPEHVQTLIQGLLKPESQ